MAAMAHLRRPGPLDIPSLAACGGWKAKVRVSAGLAPSVAVRDNLGLPKRLYFLFLSHLEGTCWAGCTLSCWEATRPLSRSLSWVGTRASTSPCLSVGVRVLVAPWPLAFPTLSGSECLQLLPGASGNLC